MDFESLAVGFLTGAVTGAVGNFLADKYTDTRREKKAVRDVERQWEDLERRYPAILSEMRKDVLNPDSNAARAFFLKSSGTIIAFTSEPALEYFTDVHEELRPAMLMLEQLGYITDITPGNTPMYRMHEHFVDRLKTEPRKQFALKRWFKKGVLNPSEKCG